MPDSNGSVTATVADGIATVSFFHPKGNSLPASVLKRLASKSEDLREIFEENHTVSDKIDLIMKMMSSGIALKFTELFAGAASRTEIVVTFLALLELIRLKQVRCVQDEPFAEIELRPA